MSILIDVWDIGTFDSEIVDLLRLNAEFLRRFCDSERSITIERAAVKLWTPPKQNAHSGNYHSLIDVVTGLMARRTIRAWHFTRLTEFEVKTILADGVSPTTLVSLKTRLDAQVNNGTFNQKTADLLFAQSPLHSEAFGDRLNKFWMTSHPIEPSSGLVNLLLENWGGESVYWCHEEGEVLSLLSAIGKPRVLEIAVSLSLANRFTDHCAARSVVSSYAKYLGCGMEEQTFDLYVSKPLDGKSIVKVISEGDDAYKALAVGYPTKYSARES